MDPNELVQQARDALTVEQVFGDPYERNGVTIIPAASIRGGAGGGRGEGSTPDGEGSGSGSGGSSDLPPSQPVRTSSSEPMCVGNRPST